MAFLQDAGGAVVVLRGDEDEAVEGGDLLGPLLRVLALVLAHRRGQRLVQVRQRVVPQVDELELGSLR
jgi:hypothetical protein